MDVIGHAADSQGLDVVLAPNATEIRPKAVADFAREQWLASFRGEDAMKETTGEGVHQFFRPCRDSADVATSFPALKRWAMFQKDVGSKQRQLRLVLLGAGEADAEADQAHGLSRARERFVKKGAKLFERGLKASALDSR